MRDKFVCIFTSVLSILSFVQDGLSYSCSPSSSGTLCHLTVTDDVFVESSYNQNGYDFLIIGIHPSYPLKRTLVKFEDIPSECQEVIEAKMYIYYWYAHKASFMSEAQVPWITRPIQARQILKSWRENEVTRNIRFFGAPWSESYLNLNNVDAISHVDDTQIISRNTSSGYIKWNITTTAQNWLAGQTNHGILLLVSNENQLGRDIRFYSREHYPKREPYLEVLCATNSVTNGTDTTSEITITTGTSATDLADTTAGKDVSGIADETTMSDETMPTYGSEGCSFSAGNILCRLAATGDVYVYDSTNQNFRDFLIAGIHPNYPLKRTLLKFKNIPPGCEAIIEAKMYVYYWYAHKASFMSEAQVPWIPRPIQARQVLKSWKENEATRDNRFFGTPWSGPYLNLRNVDAASHVDDTQTFTRKTRSSYIMWNVTTTAQNWLDGQPNNGIILLVSNEDEFGREIRFFSREHALDREPYLEILCKSTTVAGMSVFTDIIRYSDIGEIGSFRKNGGTGIFHYSAIVNALTIFTMLMALS